MLLALLVRLLTTYFADIYSSSWYTGKAQLEYQRGHYEVSLSALRTVLQNQPNCPASVRVGLGMCFAKLKQLDKVSPLHIRVWLALGL
jgi:lipopolysaccharide biosynthesis regulator YciM